MSYFSYIFLVILLAMQSSSFSSELPRVSPLKDVSPLRHDSSSWEDKVPGVDSAPEHKDVILCKHENEFYKNECLAWVAMERDTSESDEDEKFDSGMPLDAKSLESWKTRKFCLNLFLKTRERLPALLNNAIYFHGTSSVALMMYLGHFSEPADAGSLLSLGYLEKIHKVPFSGEIIFGRSGINKSHVSLTNLDDINTAINRYTKAESPVTLESLQHILTQGEEGLRKHPDSIVFKHVVEIQTQRIARFQILSEEEKIFLTDPFPVLFGAVLAREKEVRKVRSDIKGERAVKRVDSNEIKVIFVPRERISQVKSILAEHAALLSRQHIHVESLQTLKEFVSPPPASSPTKMSPTSFAGVSWSHQEFSRLRLDPHHEGRIIWDTSNWKNCIYR